MAATILICDNEKSFRALIPASLTKGGYTFAEARDEHESLDLAHGLVVALQALARAASIDLDAGAPPGKWWLVVVAPHAYRRVA